MVKRHDRVNIRLTHPGLYHSMVTFGLMDVALAVNFWITTPAFNPFSINKNLVGVVFFVLGVAQLVFLRVFRSLRMVRIGLAVSIFVMVSWGLTNVQQFINGHTSLQLPILYLTLGALQYVLLIESPVNPMTKKRK